MAETRQLRSPAEFRYDARLSSGVSEQPVPVARQPEGGICATLPHVAADGGARDDAAERYVRVTIADGVARGVLVVHLYDLGATRGYRLVGLERPEP
jgi:hypothetical protein